MGMLPIVAILVGCNKLHLTMLHLNLQAERSKGQASETVMLVRSALLRWMWGLFFPQPDWHVPVCRHVWMATVLA